MRLELKATLTSVVGIKNIGLVFGEAALLSISKSLRALTLYVQD